VALARAELLLPPGEHDAVEIDPALLQPELQVPAPAYGAHPFKQGVHDAEGGPRVAGAEGLQLLQGLDAVHVEQRRVLDAQIAAQARRLRRRHAAVILRERGAEAGDLLPPYREPRGQRVAAEALQPAGAGGQRVEEVEVPAAAAGALPAVPVEAYHDGGQGKLLSELGGGYAYNALVPALGGEDYGGRGFFAAQLAAGGLVDVVLYLLPLPVEAAELRGEAGGLALVPGQQQADGDVRTAEPSGGVEPRREGEAHGRGAYPPAQRAGLLQQGAVAGPGRL